MSLISQPVDFTSPFLQSSAAVQQNFTLEAIHRKWNNSNLGKPAKLTTVKRWLNAGPVTKNPRFEPWVIGLAAAFK